MSLPWTGPSSWSHRRWGWMVGSILAAQVFLIWLLGDRGPIIPPPPRPGTTLRLELNPQVDSPSTLAWATSDPTLFALANRHSFSGAAWLNLRPSEHQLRDWTETGRWLACDDTILGATFRQFVQSRSSPPWLVAEKPEPRLVELFVTNEPAPTQSSWRIEGDLARRPLATSLQLWVQPSAEILTDSVVQVAVSPAGDVLSANLWSSCGLPTADQDALDLAKTVRFQPLPGADSPRSRPGDQTPWLASPIGFWPAPGALRAPNPSSLNAGAIDDRRGVTAPIPNPFPLAWGRLVFSWCTTNLPATNQTIIKP